MTTYISILRGINVSGQKMIKMDTLKQLYVDLGFKNISTYIQSGNVVFKCKKAKESGLAKKITQKIKDHFNFDVPVLVIEAPEMKALVKKNPFVKDKSKDSAFLHVTFLSDTPETTDINKIIASTYLPDEYKIIDKAVYLCCPNGYGNTKLNNTFFEKKLNCSATTRNWKTTNELINIAEQLE
jgi:uncharacterized protein (DUF1697 family)